MGLRKVQREDDAPESGVRPRLVVLEPGASQSTEDVLREVGEEVFFDVFRLVRGLSPLQSPWIRLGVPQAVGAAAQVSTWSFDDEPPIKVLKRRWPELVPGASALDLVAHLMVEQICR